MSESKGLARGYSWEPFQPGNTKSMRHGARSERTITPIAAQIASATIEASPALAAPEFREAVLEYARAQAQVELLETYLDQKGLIHTSGRKKGNVQNAADFLLRARRHAQKVREQLGLTPLAASRISRPRTPDIALIFAEQSDE